MIIIAFLTTPKLKTKTNYFIFSLAVADLLVGLFSVPLWIYFIVTFDFKNDLYKYYQLGDIVSGVSSILHLTCISIERCYAIVAPLKHRKISKGMQKLLPFQHTFFLTFYIFLSLLFLLPFSRSYPSLVNSLRLSKPLLNLFPSSYYFSFSSAYSPYNSLIFNCSVFLAAKIFAGIVLSWLLAIFNALLRKLSGWKDVAIFNTFTFFFVPSLLIVAAYIAIFFVAKRSLKEHSRRSLKKVYS